MTNVRRFVTVCLGLIFAFGVRQLTATETIFAGVPVYTVMSTVDTDLSLPVIGANAFTPLNIACPTAAGAKGCTFRITVSAVVSSNSPNAFLQVTTAPFMTMSPAPVIPIDVTTSVVAPFTMQWVVKNVPAGTSPEVQVIGALATGSTVLKQRTLSIDVMYGLV